MRFSFYKHILLVCIILFSYLMQTTSAEAVGPNGLFGEYFTRMVKNCNVNGNGGVITGFRTDSFGETICADIKSLLFQSFGTITTPPGKAVVGFDTNGIKFDYIFWRPGQFGQGIYYPYQNVGIGIANPFSRLDIAGGWWGYNMRALSAFGYENSDPQSPEGSINVNDIFLRSIGKWASDMNTTSYHIVTKNCSWNTPPGWGQDSICPSGKIMTGLCASGKDDDCKKNGVWGYQTPYCCEIDLVPY